MLHKDSAHLSSNNFLFLPLSKVDRCQMEMSKTVTNQIYYQFAKLIARGAFKAASLQVQRDSSVRNGRFKNLAQRDERTLMESIREGPIVIS